MVEDDSCFDVFESGGCLSSSVVVVGMQSLVWIGVLVGVCW